MRDFCLEILDLDNSIRFAGIVTADGKVSAMQHRQGKKDPMLTTEESQLYVMQSAIRMSSRRTLEEKLGRPVFSFTEYENIFGLAVPINENRNKGIKESIFTISIDKDYPDPLSLITRKILPLIRHAV